MSAVLDSSAVLAVINGEAGAERVEDLLTGGSIGAANFSEVLSKLVDRGHDDGAAAAVLDALPLTVLPMDAAQARRAGLLRRQTRRLGLSLGDRACLALALETGLPVVTADRVWAQLDLGIEVTVVR